MKKRKKRKGLRSIINDIKKGAASVVSVVISPMTDDVPNIKKNKK